MKRHYILGICLVICAQSLWAQDTFSIVAVDPATGEVGSAGATCVEGIGALGGVILLSGIVPGRGGVNAQAYICINPHINLDNGIARLSAGDAPQTVIDWLVNNDACASQSFNPTYRQYGIAALNEAGAPETAAYTGQNTDDWKGHLLGETYSIQGNILLGPEVLEEMEAGFNNTDGSLAERLMAAMQGGNIPGADARCLADGTSSTSAFLRVFKPDDSPSSPYLELNVAEVPAGVEPIDSLQALFDEWQLTDASEVDLFNMPDFKVFPNPASAVVQVHLSEKLSIAQLYLEWYDAIGQKSSQTNVQAYKMTLETPNNAGVYRLVLRDQQGNVLHQESVVVTN